MGCHYLLAEVQVLSVKDHLHREKAEAKTKIFFVIYFSDLCRMFFDLLRFRSHFHLVWIGL